MNTPAFELNFGEPLAPQLNLLAALAPTLSYDQISKFRRRLNKNVGQIPSNWVLREVRIAILGQVTKEYIQEVLDFTLLLHGVRASFWLSDFQYKDLLAERNEALSSFKPDVVLVIGCANEISYPSNYGEEDQTFEATIKREARGYFAFAEGLQKWLGALVILDGFPLLAPRALGNLDYAAKGIVRYLREINAEVQKLCGHLVRFHDVEYLSGDIGASNWRDQRLWLHAKMPIAPEATATYTLSLGALIKASLGLTKKCLVLDLDNTLWGGVIGDVGLGGILIGQGDPTSEAFAHFQLFCKRLKKQGLLLAICSKNNEAIAKEVFTDHSDMILKLSDVDLFVANWETKSSNLQQIAKRLNIGLDSLVFFDDNPAEREEVRSLLPEVFVVEAPADPADYVRTLSQLNLFELASLSAEDQNRSQLYSAEAKRAEFETRVGNYAEYLQQLRMEASITPINIDNLARVTQLINKTNQFNLTTRRYTEAQVEALMQNPEYLTRAVRVQDRFGDHGLISVFIGKIEKNRLTVEAWLMSCRVLKRSVEEFLLNDIIQESTRRGITEILGEYLPTAKNALVKDLFPNLGFRQTDNDKWSLQAPFNNPQHFIGTLNYGNS